MRIRPMRAGDLPAMLDLWVAAWQATMPEIDFSARRDWLAERLAEFERNGVAILCAADEADAVLGFATIDLSSAYLDQLAVASSCFGRGVAQMLLDACKRIAPGRIDLRVDEANPRAMRFYERENFVRVGLVASTVTGRPVWRMCWTGD